MTTKNFNFQTKFLLDDVTFGLEISSEKYNSQEQGLVGNTDRQVITLTEDDRGVSMSRLGFLHTGSEFQMTGNGSLNDANEEQLKTFALRWVMVAMGAVMQMNEARTLQDEEVVAVDPAMLLGAQEFMDIMKHFFPDMF